MDLVDLAQGAQTLGIVGFLLLAIIVILAGLYRGWWYPRPYVEDLRRERDELKQQLSRSTSVAEVAVTKVPEKP